MPYPAAFGNFIPIWVSGFLGSVFLGITEFPLRRLMGLKTFTLGGFLLWFLFEFFFLTGGMLLIFGEWHETFFHELRIVIRYTSSLTVLPYALSLLIIAVAKLNHSVKESNLALSQIGKQLVFKEESGKTVLAIKPENVLYLKSENNYTSVVYLENENASKTLIRNNLKKLEQEIIYPNLLRIHRSYMVNLEHVATVQRIKGSFQIQLDGMPDQWIKVSDSYRESFENSIQKPVS